LAWVITLSGLLSSHLSLANSDIHISIVKSSNNSYFNQTIQSLINHTGKAVHLNVLDLESSSSNSTLLQNSDLIISLGAAATLSTTSNYPDKRVISAYLTERQLKDLKLAKKNHLAVLLDQPLSRYLVFSHLVSNAKSVGIVNHSTAKLSLKQRKLLQRLNFKLAQYQIDRTEELLIRIRQLITQNDTLLMLPDQTIYNRNSLKGVLLTTYRGRMPVISYSPAHVKSGAMASIFSSPADIGQHLGDLVSQFLNSSYIPDGFQQYARYYSTVFNRRVAHALGLTLPDKKQLHIILDEQLR